MRSLRKAARKVAVFHLPLRDLVDEALSPCCLRRAGGSCWSLVQVSSMKTSRLGSMPSPFDRFAIVCGATYVRAILLRVRQGSFFDRDVPIRRKKRLIIEVSALTPHSAERRSHRALKRDVRFLDPCVASQKGPVRHQLEAR